MSTKYFCDVCKNEIPLYKRIHVLGFTSIKIDTFCPECWGKAVKSLPLEIDREDTKI